jgi:hypothetical protein
MGKKNFHIGLKEYIHAVKMADRAIELESSCGFKCRTRIHKSKKTYNRKEGKKIDFDPSFYFTKTAICYFSDR